MKKYILTCLALLFAISFHAKTTQKMTLTEILKQRHSVRSYSNKPLTQEQILEVLWAGNGMSDSGRRTAPSAVNAQDIDLYVCSTQGVSKYNPQQNSLVPVTEMDIRPYMQVQNAFIMVAPITILIVSNQEKFVKDRPNHRNEIFGYIDAGLVSQNISLYCTAAGLGTVPCDPPMQIAEIQKALNLNSKHIPVMYHPVGYQK